jgi:hypothetical protein
MGILEGIGTKIATDLTVAGAKEVTKRLLSKGADFKEPVIYFGLFCNFKEMPSYDVAKSELTEIILQMNPKGRKLIEDKQSFDYDITWDIFEGCDFPDFSWEQDAVVEEDNECEEEIDTSLASNCVSGFTFWLAPLPFENRKNMIISAYHILDEINHKIQENLYLSISKNRIFVFIGTDTDTSKGIYSKLLKKMKEQKLAGNPVLQSLTDKAMMLVVPLREQLTAISVAESFKRWGVI